MFRSWRDFGGNWRFLVVELERFGVHFGIGGGLKVV